MASDDSDVLIDSDDIDPERLPGCRTVPWMEQPFDAHGRVSHRVGHGTDGSGGWGVYRLFSVSLVER